MVTVGRATLIALSLCNAGTGWSQDTLPRVALDVTSFGLVTLAAGQTVRLSVVNAAVADPRLPPGPCVQDSRLPPGPCVVHIVFRNSAGSVIASSSETLAPGQGASLDVSDALLVPGRTAGRQVWASIAVESPAVEPSKKLPPGPCIATLEVLDNETGRAVLLHPGTTLRQIVSSSPTTEERQ
jgi:hypothetical protein